ncbi:MAG: hypothetical protein RQ761_13285, partial [Bacteroidales bacterium]|nr:hypothetical protein [Bacteroidales bacterium]
MKYLFFIVSIVTCLLSNAQQVYFNKLIRNDIAEQPTAILEDDSCYYVFGGQIDSITSKQKIFFYKLGKNANLLKYCYWGDAYKTYGACKMIFTSDNNLVSCGIIIDTIQVDSMPVGYGFIQKMNKNGDTLWRQKYFDTISLYKGSFLGIRSLQETYDKGYILSGHIKGSVKNEYRQILIKTDSLGYGQWYKLSNKHPGYEIYPWSISITSDTGYIVAGRYWNGQNYDGWLYKTDQYGNSQWEKFLGGQYDDWIESAIATSDGNIACVLTDTY